MRVENELRHRVIEALRPDAPAVGVSVEDEVVTLAGTVPSLDTKDAAVEIASRVRGVSAVVDQLHVADRSWTHPIIENVLLPVDLSDERVGSLRLARLVASTFGARVTVLYADPIGASAGREAPYDARLRRMIELYSTPHLDSYPFQIEISTGPTAQTILARAETSGNNLIVMGTSAREEGGHDSIHSVSTAVVRGARCPVLTIGEHDYPGVQRGVGIRTILCPVNLTPGARESVRYAAKLADAFRANLIVVRVIEPEKITNMAREEAELHLWLGDHLPGTTLRGVRPYRRLVVRGPVTDAVLECAVRFGSDLLVIGAEQMNVEGTDVVGSTTEQLLRSSATPVLVVPHRLA